MAALRVPFKADSYIELIELITKGEIDSIREEYSQDLFNVIKLMTNKNPRKRPTAKLLVTIPQVVQSLYKSIVEKTKELYFKEKTLSKKELSLFKNEQNLKRQQNEFKRKFENFKRLEEMKTKNNLRTTRNNMVEYNTDVNIVKKDSLEMQRLNHTTNQDVSSMYSSQERSKEAPNKSTYKSYNMDAKENINESNIMVSSTSSNQNKTFLSQPNSKNGSGHFEDSGIGYTKPSLKKYYNKYPGKQIEFNLYSEGNSSGSMEMGNPRAANGKMQSRMTGNTETTLATKNFQAWSRQQDNKSIDKSFEGSKQTANNSMNKGFRRPPTGQNITQRSIAIDKSINENFVKKSNDFQMNMLKRISSTDNFAKNEENSRNRLGNRKSIPATYRGDEEFCTFQAPESTFQIMSSRRRNNENGANIQNEIMKNSTQPILTKAESDKPHIPQAQEIIKNLKLKNPIQNSNLSRTMSRGKLVQDQTNIKLQQQKFSNKGKQFQSINDLLLKMGSAKETVTPKNINLTQLAQGRA